MLRRQLGWTAAGRARTPRVHDLRHRMVVRRIQAWHARGADVDAKIAVLATYLGHAEVRNLYWYLSAVPELMSIIAGRARISPGTTRQLSHEITADRVPAAGAGLLPVRAPGMSRPFGSTAIVARPGKEGARLCAAVRSSGSTMTAPGAAAGWICGSTTTTVGWP